MVILCLLWSDLVTPKCSGLILKQDVFQNNMLSNKMFEPMDAILKFLIVDIFLFKFSWIWSAMGLSIIYFCKIACFCCLIMTLLNRWNVPHRSRPVTQAWRLLCINLAHKQATREFSEYEEEKHVNTIGRIDPRNLLESSSSARWNFCLAENCGYWLLCISVRI